MAQVARLFKVPQQVEEVSDDLCPTPPAGAVDGRVLFAAVHDELHALGVTMPRTVIAVSVRHGKSALTDGVEWPLVVAGCVMAIRTNRSRFAHEVIAELALVKARAHLTRAEFNQMVATEKAKGSQIASALDGAFAPNGKVAS